MKYIIKIYSPKPPTKVTDKMLDGTDGELFSKAFEINEMLQKHMKRYILVSWLLAIPAIALFLVASYHLFFMIGCVVLIASVFYMRSLYVEKNEFGIKYFDIYLNEAIEGRQSIYFYTITLKDNKLYDLVKRKLGESYLQPDTFY